MFKFSNLVSVGFMLVCLSKTEASATETTSKPIDFSAEAIAGDFPWIVRIVKIVWVPSTGLKEYEHLCAGSLISNRHVLTLESCLLKSNQTGDITVLAGDAVSGSVYEIDLPIQSYVAEKKVEFKETSLAIIQLSRQIPITKTIQPIMLTTSAKTENYYQSSIWFKHDDGRLKMRPYVQFTMKDCCKRENVICMSWTDVNHKLLSGSPIFNDPTFAYFELVGLGLCSGVECCKEYPYHDNYVRLTPRIVEWIHRSISAMRKNELKKSSGKKKKVQSSKRSEARKAFFGDNIFDPIN